MSTRQLVKTFRQLAKQRGRIVTFDDVRARRSPETETFLIIGGPVGADMKSAVKEVKVPEGGSS